MCSTVLLGWLCHRVCHVVGSYLVFNSLFLIFSLIPQLIVRMTRRHFSKRGRGVYIIWQRTIHQWVGA